MSEQSAKNSNTRRTFWTIAAFYFLIAFEFLYMASPFAIYFYSVYGPGLNFINKVPALTWLTSVFLPHIVIETSCPVVNSHNYLGAALFVIGFLGFCITAGQVYYYKIRRKGVVTGGIYKFMRHPQYLFLIVSSLGLLLLWPRFIVLFPFVAMLFAYYFLAQVEEKECERKFGQSYIQYKNRTGMFLPFRVPLFDKLPGLPAAGLKRYLAILMLYVLTVATAIWLASGVRNWSLSSLYMLAREDHVYISVGRIEPTRLEQIATIATSSPGVQVRLESNEGKFINYVLPQEWYVSEIGLNRVLGGGGHHFPQNYDKNSYKVVITKAELRAGQDPQGKAILLNTVRRTTVLEVFVDLSSGHVVKILEPPESVPYAGIPRPIY